MQARFYIILISFTAMLLAGCTSESERPGDRNAYASDPAFAGTNNSPEIETAVGQAISGVANLAPERIRVAAIIDGLRIIAGRRAISPQVCWLIGTLQITNSNRIEKGMVVFDSTVVEAGGHRWASVNLRLVEPKTGSDPQLQSLLQALKSNNIEVSDGHDSGRGLWLETVTLRKWKN